MNLADVIVSDPDAEVVENPESKAEEPAKTETHAEPAKAENAADVPEKFRGKSVKELVDMYQNLESVHGRTANDLGVQRQLTDRLLGLDAKRTADLQANTPPAKKVVPITANDILDRPQETLDRVIEERVSKVTEDVSQRLARAEAALAQQTFANRHPDFQSVVQDSAFIDWVKASPIRLRAAGAANGGNWQIADELLSEYKGSRSAPAATTAAEKPQADLEGARRASLETRGQSGGTDGKSNGGKEIFRRAALIKMRIEDPEGYADEEFQARVLLAHQEGRVR